MKTIIRRLNNKIVLFIICFIIISAYFLLQKNSVVISAIDPNLLPLISNNKIQTAQYLSNELPVEQLNKKTSKTSLVISLDEQFIQDTKSSQDRIDYYFNVLKDGGNILVFTGPNYFSKESITNSRLGRYLPETIKTAKASWEERSIEAKPDYNLDGFYQVANTKGMEVKMRSEKGDPLLVSVPVQNGHINIFLGFIYSPGEIKSAQWQSNRAIMTFLAQKSASNKALVKTANLLLLLVALALTTLAISKIRKRFILTDYISYSLIAILTILLSTGLFASGHPAFFEGTFQTAAIETVRQAIEKYHHFPIWSNNIWNGGPVFLGIYPWIYSLIPFIGLSVFTGTIAAFKIIYILLFFLLGIAGYNATKQFGMGKSSSVFTVALLMTSGMICTNVFQWGSAGMFIAIIVAASLFGLVSSFLEEPSAVESIKIALYLALIFLFQQQLYLLVVIGILAYSLAFVARSKNWNFVKFILPIVILNALLCAAWWIPFLAHRGLLNMPLITGTFSIETTSLYSTPSIIQAVLASGLGHSTPLILQSISITGWSSVGLLVPAVFSLLSLSYYKRNKYVAPLVITSLIMILLSAGIFLPGTIFSVFYKILPFLHLIRTPARAMLIANITLSISSGIFLSELLKEKESLAKKVVVSIAIIGALTSIYSFKFETNEKSGYQMRTDGPLNLTKVLRENTSDNGSILMLPVDSWPQYGVPYESALFENRSSLYSQALSIRNEPLFLNKKFVIGSTPDQDAIKSSFDSISKIERDISDENSNSFIEDISFDWRIRYLVISKKLYMAPKIFWLKSQKDLKINFESSDYLILEKGNSINTDVIWKHDPLINIQYIKNEEGKYTIQTEDEFGRIDVGESYFPGWTISSAQDPGTSIEDCKPFVCFYAKTNSEYVIEYKPTGEMKTGWLVSLVTLTMSLLAITISQARKLSKRRYHTK